MNLGRLFTYMVKAAAGQQPAPYLPMERDPKYHRAGWWRRNFGLFFDKDSTNAMVRRKQQSMDALQNYITTHGLKGLNGHYDAALALDYMNEALADMDYKGVNNLDTFVSKFQNTTGAPGIAAYLPNVINELIAADTSGRGDYDVRREQGGLDSEQWAAAVNAVAGRHNMPEVAKKLLARMGSMKGDARRNALRMLYNAHQQQLRQIPQSAGQQPTQAPVGQQPVQAPVGQHPDTPTQQPSQAPLLLSKSPRLQKLRHVRQAAPQSAAADPKPANTPVQAPTISEGTHVVTGPDGKQYRSSNAESKAQTAAGIGAALAAGQNPFVEASTTAPGASAPTPVNMNAGQDAVRNQINSNINAGRSMYSNMGAAGKFMTEAQRNAMKAATPYEDSGLRMVGHSAAGTTQTYVGRSGRGRITVGADAAAGHYRGAGAVDTNPRSRYKPAQPRTQSPVKPAQVR